MFTSAVITLAILSAGPIVDRPRFVAGPEANEGAFEVVVRTQGVALDEEAGAREMLARLKTATDAVCVRQLQGRMSADWHGCRRETLDQAVRRLNAPAVTRAHEAGR